MRDSCKFVVQPHKASPSKCEARTFPHTDEGYKEAREYGEECVEQVDRSDDAYEGFNVMNIFSSCGGIGVRVSASYFNGDIMEGDTAIWPMDPDLGWD